MAFFSVSVGFNRNCAGNNGISRLSRKTKRILYLGFSPCLIKNFRFFTFLNSYDKKIFRFFPGSLKTLKFPLDTVRPFYFKTNACYILSESS